ncbi:MAG TPA: phosphoribosylformylglycinamidine cyclo-ligase [Actinomycetota bacterium]|nr:phosphoribosylformylglycinamidine cyclo-ligase [Actinomycetota bacterium]
MTVDWSAGQEAYRRSGVDLQAAARAVGLIEDVAGKASRPEVVGGVGGFAGLFKMGDGRLLAAATDGVGTKLEIARMLKKFDGIGIDCVAMCANDVACTGAEPLFFLDYLVVERLVPEDVAAIVAGVAEGCLRAGCALLGGETAEHPRVLPAGSFDLAGFCVGIVEEDALLGPHMVAEGDVVVGLRSSGVHANGFSLIGKVLVRDVESLQTHVPVLGRTLGEELLEPTSVYVRPLLALIREGLVRSAAHITGGGFHENVPRALPPDLGAVIDTSSWTPHPIFSLIAQAAELEPQQLFGVLNMGIGLVTVVPRGTEDDVVGLSHAMGVEGIVIGEVVPASGVRLR